ncbi:hypothetical protein R3P38DRAFT_2829312 [Favolaschia claudopus]|uniref:Epidermal growth factor receptor-like transmembrane-juxtamembrane segment domain-containing protein n=1 Tax=Favolaschia claudopus TaxID=2862362 RepID=A0AAW0ED04_9AGAR
MLPSGVGFLKFFLTLFLRDTLPIYAQARLTPRSKSFTNVQRDSAPASPLASANWIWAANSSTEKNIAFIKNITAPANKTAVSAVISVTAVENFTLWVNGQPIGQAAGGRDGWKNALVLQAALNDSVNTFSVFVTNGDKPASAPPGLLAAIQVTYKDSTNSTFLSDATWLATSTSIPFRFPMPMDFSAFAPVDVIAPYGSGPWGQNSVALPPPDPNPLTLQQSSWIWSTVNSSISADTGSVGFRKDYATPSGKSAVSATILLTVDDNFALYLNDAYIGAPPGVTVSAYQHPQQFTVNLNASRNVFTVVGQNFPTMKPHGNPAGFIAAIKVFFEDGTTDMIRTDPSWLAGPLVSAAVFLSSADKFLSPAIVQGPFGMNPWKQLSTISNVAAAVTVPTAPWNKFLEGLSNQSQSKSKVPVGAIVGAAVGGVVLFALCLTIFLICRRRRQKARSTVALEVASDAASFSERSISPFATLQSNPLPSKLERRNDVPDSDSASEAPPPSYADAESALSFTAPSGRSIAAVNGGYRIKR